MRKECSPFFTQCNHISSQKLLNFVLSHFFGNSVYLNSVHKMQRYSLAVSVLILCMRIVEKQLIINISRNQQVILVTAMLWSGMHTVMWLFCFSQQKQKCCITYLLMNAGSAGTNSWRGTTRPRPSNIAVGKLFSRKFSSLRRSRQELPRSGPSQL